MRLYDLIWKRTLASQMSDALLDSTSVDIDASTTSGKTYVFRATGSVLKFPGFRRLYMEDVDDSSDEGDQALLPEMKEGDVPKCLGLDPRQHFTQPPPKFTEASIVKSLEEQGIGRPSTYAPTISTIQNRHYVNKEGGRFKPTALGVTVCDLLNQNFPDIMDTGFTAQMEEDLDDIAQGSREWVPVLGDFYEGFSKSVADAMDIPRMKVEDELTDQSCEECERPMAIKMGRFGPFLSCSGFPECRNSKPYRIPTGRDLPQMRRRPRPEARRQAGIDVLRLLQLPQLRLLRQAEAPAPALPRVRVSAGGPRPEQGAVHLLRLQGRRA